MLEANRLGAEQRWQDAQDLLRRNQRDPFPGAPVLPVNAVKALLEYSATPLHDANGARDSALEQGAGLVNGVGAATPAYNIDTTRAAGQYWLTNATAGWTTFDGASEPWSGTVIWRTALLHGTSVVDLRQAAWEDNIVWGTLALDEDNIVWGTLDEDNIVWGTMDEDNIVWGTSQNRVDALGLAGGSL
jgi:hypothetical protein